MNGVNRIWYRATWISGLLLTMGTTACDDDDDGTGTGGAGGGATGGRSGVGGKSVGGGGATGKGGQTSVTGGTSSGGGANRGGGDSGGNAGDSGSGGSSGGSGGAIGGAGGAGGNTSGTATGGMVGVGAAGGTTATGGVGGQIASTGGTSTGGAAIAGSTSGGATTGGAAGGGVTTGGTAAGGTATAGTNNGGTAGVAGVAGFGTAGTDRNVFRPELVPFTPARLNGLTRPDGFRINVFAQNLGGPRMLAVHDGHVYVTRPEEDDVMMLTDMDGDGVAETSDQARSGLDGVHGIVFRGNIVYLATVTNVYRAPVNTDGTFGTPTSIIDDLPPGGQHGRRTLGIGPDNLLYISIGSSCDACRETDPDYATMQRSELDGSARTILASGLRNTIGFAWHPTTQQLWGMDQGSDWRGNDLPPEELNRIVAGNYGWPYCYSQRTVDPITEDPPTGTKAAFCAASVPPVLEYQAHGSPIQMTFYTGNMFPAEYVNDVFLALHGSWNRFPPAGYKIVRILYDDAGTPTGFQDFVSGFLVNAGSQQFGRPAGIVVAEDGALLFSDDDNGIVYRVSYAP